MKLFELKPGERKEFTPSNTNSKYSYSKFLSDCSESIAAMQQSRSFLYRGMTDNMPDIFIGRPWGKRKPKDTSTDVQKEIDKLFKLAGFTALRSNSIFCSGSIGQARDYGNPYIIFPINGFSFTWSPKMYDLYHQLGDIATSSPSELYAKPSNAVKFRYCADGVANWIHDQIDKREFDDFNVKLYDKLYDLKDYFSDIGDMDLTQKEVMLALTKAAALANTIQKKYNFNLAPVQKEIVKIISLVKDNYYTPEELLNKWQYTDKNLPAAIRSDKEVIINGDYYAFNHEEYYTPLFRALIK
jgi:hypothetical protein